MSKQVGRAELDAEIISVVYIDPWNQVIETIQIPKDSNLHQPIGADWITSSQVTPRLEMILDDMGCLPPQEGGPKRQRFWKFKDAKRFKQEPYGGCAMVMASNSKGDTVNVTSKDLLFFQNEIEWLDIHPVDTHTETGYVNHPVFGRMHMSKKSIVWAKGKAPGDHE